MNSIHFHRRIVGYISAVALPAIIMTILSGDSGAGFLLVPVYVQFALLNKINNVGWFDLFITVLFTVVSVAFVVLQLVVLSGNSGFGGPTLNRFSDFMFGQVALTTLLWELYFWTKRNLPKWIVR
jgi:hypothetical protein